MADDKSLKDEIIGAIEAGAHDVIGDLGLDSVLDAIEAGTKAAVREYLDVHGMPR